MEIKQYLFQPTYPSPVQYGRLDPSSEAKDDYKLNQDTNQTLKNAQMQETSMKNEVKPEVTNSSNQNLLDVYA